jgi:hypothetical protein
MYSLNIFSNHTGEKVFEDERRITESAPESSKAPVEVKTSIEIDEEDRSDDPAHTGRIVFEEDGEVINEISQESAPQSSGSRGHGTDQTQLFGLTVSSLKYMTPKELYAMINGGNN